MHVQVLSVALGAVIGGTVLLVCKWILQGAIRDLFRMAKEFKPNGGSSVVDKVAAIDLRTIEIQQAVEAHLLDDTRHV